MINILNFEYLKETDEFHSEFGILEKKKHFSFTDTLAISAASVATISSLTFQQKGT